MFIGSTTQDNIAFLAVCKCPLKKKNPNGEADLSPYLANFSLQTLGLLSYLEVSLEFSRGFYCI